MVRWPKKFSFVVGVDPMINAISQVGIESFEKLESNRSILPCIFIIAARSMLVSRRTGT